MALRLRYNAPVTLTFSLACIIIFLLNDLLFPYLIQNLFTVFGRGGFQAFNILSYIRIISYPLGHSGWEHLFGNLSFILLLGPILEEKYGSFSLMIMILITAAATGIINSVFFTKGLLGASGIVFMMILLVSFTNIRKGEIPLTFIAITAFFVTKEIVNILKPNNISEAAHLIGGGFGAVFGFISSRNRI